MTKEKITWDRVSNNSNGHPRYVCHFLNLNTKKELDTLQDVSDKYNAALYRAKKLRGKKFHNKQYGGGIVFVSWDLPELDAQVRKLVAEAS